MQFTPRSAKEIAEKSLWPRGVYDFEVQTASDEKTGPTAKTPNVDYIKLNMIIFNAQGHQRYIKDNLHPAMEAKLRHFAETTGLLAKYEAGTLTAADCEGRTGKCKVKIKEDESGKYDPKNEVADYVKPKAKTEATPATAAQAEDDSSDIPF